MYINILLFILSSISNLQTQNLTALSFNLMMGQKTNITITFPYKMHCKITFTNMKNDQNYEIQTIPNKVLRPNELFITTFQDQLTIIIIYHHYILQRQTGNIFHVQLCNLKKNILFYDRNIQLPKPIFIIYQKDTMKMNNFDINDHLVFYCIGSNINSDVKIISSQKTKYYDIEDSNSHVVKQYVILTVDIINDEITCLFDSDYFIIKRLNKYMKKYSKTTRKISRKYHKMINKRNLNRSIDYPDDNDAAFGYLFGHPIIKVIFSGLIIIAFLILFPAIIFCIYGYCFRCVNPECY